MSKKGVLNVRQATFASDFFKLKKPPLPPSIRLHPQTPSGTFFDEIQSKIAAKSASNRICFHSKIIES